MAGMRCTVCGHADRAVVDRLLAAGSVSVRSIAARFGLSKSSLLRHQSSHVMKVIERQIQRRRQTEEEVLTETWTTRLENTYQLAREGAARANADAEKWPAAVGFLHVMAKSAETGMRATGEIQTQRPVTINLENIVVLPQAVPAPVRVAPAGAIDVKALPESEQVQQDK